MNDNFGDLSKKLAKELDANIKGKPGLMRRRRITKALRQAFIDGRKEEKLRLLEKVEDNKAIGLIKVLAEIKDAIERIAAHFDPKV